MKPSAGRHPGMPAIRCRDTTLTYGEMVRDADRSTALAAMVISSGKVVVVRGERTPITVVAFLVLMRVGAVYAGRPGDRPVVRCARLIRRTNAVLCLVTESQRPIAGIPLLSIGVLPAMPGQGA